MKTRVEYAFVLVLLVAISIGLYVGRGWNSTTALFPRVVGVPMLVLLAAIFVLDLRQRQKEKGDGQEDGDPAFKETAGRILRYFGWLVGFVAFIWAIGISYAIPIYIFAYMKVEGRYGWLKCFTYAVVAAGFIWILYSYVFRVGWPEGALLQIFGL